MFTQTIMSSNKILNSKPLSLRDGSQKNTKLCHYWFKTEEHKKKTVLFIFKLLFSIQEKQRMTMAVKQDFLLFYWAFLLFLRSLRRSCIEESSSDIQMLFSTEERKHDGE